MCGAAILCETNWRNAKEKLLSSKTAGTLKGYSDFELFLSVIFVIVKMVIGNVDPGDN